MSCPAILLLLSWCRTVCSAHTQSKHLLTYARWCVLLMCIPAQVVGFASPQGTQEQWDSFDWWVLHVPT